MHTQFHFFDFNADEDLQIESGHVIEQILDLAPYGSVAIGQIKREAQSYLCSIDVYSRFGPFIANTVQPSPLLALHHAQDILTRKIRDWRLRRDLRSESTNPTKDLGSVAAKAS